MDGPAIHRGRVAIADGRVAAVGPADDVAVSGRHIRLGPAIVIPGLVNAHCHLELSTYHGGLPAGDLWRWLANLVMARMQPDAPARERKAVPAAVRSMLEWGTTCVGDISRAHWLPEVLTGLPIRKVCYIELISGAMSSPADMTQLQDRLAGLPTNDPLLVPAISPHAPYTITVEDLRSCVALARQRGCPLAMHLAETRDEVEWLRHGTGRIAEWHRRLFESPPASPGVGPAAYALMAGLGACSPSGAALVHMNYADDWRGLCDVPRKCQPAIVYCPRSHHFFGHEAHPVRQMLDAGLTVAIGTDSAASHAADEARPFSVVDELRWLRRQYPDIPAQQLLAMATVHGAAAVGLTSQIGRLTAGRQGDLVAFEIPRSDIADPAAALLDGEQPASVVCIAGQMVVGPFGAPCI